MAYHNAPTRSLREENKQLRSFLLIGLAILLALLLWTFRDLLLLALPEGLTLMPTLTDVSPEFQILTTVLFASLIFGITTAGAWVYFQSTKPHETTPAEVNQQLVAELAVSARQLQLLFDNSPVPYFVMDDEGNVRNPNKATLRFFAAAEDDVRVANLYNRIAAIRGERSKPAIELFFEKIRRGISVADEEVTLKTYDDRERIALLSIYSMSEESPLLYKHLVALRDVTEERESERIKTDFLLLASHQLRTPTTAIKWHTEYLLGSKKLTLEPSVTEYLHEIHHANERMMELVGTLLTVSRIEMGVLEPQPEKIDCKALAEDLLDELNPNIEKKAQVLSVDITPEACLEADRTMVRVAIHNLLTNAIKYTPRNGTITLRIEQGDTMTTVVVRDTGYGIPQNEQSRIFSKMYRASNAKKVSADGTGLGLYLTKSFVEKLGGSIDFVSKEGEGTTFTIIMPNVQSA